MAGKRKKTKKAPEETPVEEPKPVSKPKRKEPGLTLATYLAWKGVKKGHRAGMTAFAKTKHGCTDKTEKSDKEWDALFESY